MAKGGARARSGPAPDPGSLRQDRPSVVAAAGSEWVTLPAAGRSGKVPVWPLSKASARELVLWKLEWVRPQAVEWERNGQELEVALYVRSLVAAEALDASTAARTLVRQQQEALGLSLPGLARNRWRIERVADVTAAGGKVVPIASARSQFKVARGEHADTDS